MRASSSSASSALAPAAVGSPLSTQRLLQSADQVQSSTLRTQRRDQLKDLVSSWPIKVLVLVVSVDGAPSDELSEVEVGRGRLRASTFDTWYFIEAFYPSEAKFKSFQLISHPLVEFVNRHNSSSAWKVPLLLCRHLEIVCIPPAFDLYQKDLPKDVAEKLEGVIVDSLCMRLYLFKWMSCGPEFKDRHPLNELHVRYAGIENLANIYDTIAFHHLAHAVTHIPGAKRSWIKGEARLLQYKLMQRPDMYVDICRIAQIHPPSFQNALGALDQVIESSYLRISQSTDARYNAECRVVKVTMAVHRELQIYARHEHGDHRARQRTRNDIATADRRHIPMKLTDPHPMHALDIEDCAPLCMKQNLRDMRGSVPQQAAMSHQRRYYVAHYLLELGHDKGEVVQLMRPSHALEYELERPKVALAGIPQLVAQADRERAHSLTEHDSHVRSCETLMLAGHCPHQPAVSSNRHSMSAEQKGAENRHRYRAAKEACHRGLVNIWARRKSQQHSAGREVNTQWTKSPYCFTQVALKGAGANIDA